MFHRRLLLLASLGLFMVLVLGGQLVRLAVVEGAEHHRDAQAVLSRRTLLPTVRGRILDRHGRLLAFDEPTFDVAVPYEVISGAWIDAQAAAAARRSNRGEWNELTIDERTALIEAERPAFEDRTRAIWRTIETWGGLEPGELERRRNEIKRRVHRIATAVHEQQRLAELEAHGPEAAARFVPRPIREQVIGHVILPDVEDELAFRFMDLADRNPELLEVDDSVSRLRPHEAATVTVPRGGFPRHLRDETPATVEVRGSIDLILGDVREGVWAEDVERRPLNDAMTGRIIDLGGYRVGDSVGSRGIERAYEAVLRGERGLIRERRDTGERERTDPRPGRDVRLTIDVELQQRVHALLDHDLGLTTVQPWHLNPALGEGWPLDAAVVVLEIATGEVLAMVSTPTPADRDGIAPQRLDAAAPWVNRPTSAIYPPGSIVKPLVLVSAVAEGRHCIDETIDCDGHFFEARRDIARCWYYRARYGFGTHGPLLAAEALARSCNIYFYTLADRLGPDRLLDWLGYFGLGRRLETGLTWTNGEGVRLGGVPGVAPDAEAVAGLRSRGEARAATIFMGIGQGPIAWTPLHAANAFAILARGGVRREPTVVADPPPPRSAAGALADDAGPPRGPDRRLDPSAVDAALEGLRQSVTETYGTGHHVFYADEQPTWDPIINAEGVTVWGKTGTAQSPPLRLDTDLDGDRDEHDVSITGVDHAWWVGMVGPSGSARPLYAVAVLVEYGGSGGRVAGPIANEVIRALQELDYLPGGAW